MLRSTIEHVPNQPKTPHLTVRVPVELREAAKRVAAERGETLSEVVREALADYVDRHEADE